MPNVTNITPPRVPVVDPQTGLVTRDWYRFFANLFNITGAGTTQTTITDLLVSPPSVVGTMGYQDETNVYITGGYIAPAGGGTGQQTYDVGDTLYASAADTLTRLPKPPINSYLGMGSDGAANWVAPVFGQFSSSVTQIPAVINTAYAATYNTAGFSNEVTYTSGDSKIYVQRTGVYNVQFSTQLHKISGTVGYIYLWFRLNGTDITNSASKIAIQGASAETLATVNLFMALRNGDYVEIMWSVSDTNCRLLASAASSPVPGIPSIITTINQVSA
jgi:hypothetical protein